MKKLLFIAATVVTTFTTNAQDYFHGAGVQMNYAIFTFSGSLEASSVPGAFYKATLGFENRKGPSFAVSAYPFVGLAINTVEGSYLGAELPILGEIHFGEFDDRDFFLGAGFSASFTASDSYYYGSTGGAVIGPSATLGGQFELRDQLIGLRLGYVYGINRGEPIIDFTTLEESKVSKTLLTFGVYYVFGG